MRPPDTKPADANKDAPSKAARTQGRIMSVTMCVVMDGGEAAEDEFAERQAGQETMCLPPDLIID
jgi:hypothetical protein